MQDRDRPVQLGNELHTAREQARRSLRSVAREAAISAAYLQKLERGAVASPSPNILGRLADVLGIDYARLMWAAGFPGAPPRPAPISRLEIKLAAAELTETEEAAIAAFVDFLVAERRSATGGERPRRRGR